MKNKLKIQPEETPETIQPEQPEETPEIIQPENLNKKDSEVLIEELLKADNKNFILETTPKRGRGRPKGSTKKGDPNLINNSQPEQLEQPEQMPEIYFSESLSEMLLNGYIKGILKSENLAQKDEIEAFTQSVKVVFKKYLPATISEHSELISLATVFISVNVSRLKL